MKKFTVFTLILTVIVVVVVSEMFVNDYLPAIGGGEDKNSSGENMEVNLPETLDLSKSMETSVLGDTKNRLGADVVSEEGAVSDEIAILDDGTVPLDLVESAGSGSGASDLPEDYLPLLESLTEPGNPIDTEILTESSDFEDFSFDASKISPTSVSIYLRDEQIKSAGFDSAYLEKELSDGKLFKTIQIDDLFDTEVTKTAIRTEEAALAKVYIFKTGINTEISEVYELIKLRASGGLNIQVNETDEYGSSSFYMNDQMRSSTAFLVVRMGGFIYAFSYPKEYHSQIKNLIKLIEWDIS
ncbi:MAG: hypothetical protein AAB540_01755 [Patescibacteria group bacterium]